MAIIKWEPFADIERFFDEDFSLMPFAKFGRDLAVDLYEEGDNLIAEMHLPGVEPERVDVSVEDNHLRVVGSREEEKETKKKNFYSKEIKRGSFERIVRLPIAVDKAKVHAECKNGVLKVTLPKQVKTEANKIKVEIKK